MRLAQFGWDLTLRIPAWSSQRVKKSSPMWQSPYCSQSCNQKESTRYQVRGCQADLRPSTNRGKQQTKSQSGIACRIDGRQQEKPLFNSKKHIESFARQKVRKILSIEHERECEWITQMCRRFGVRYWSQMRQNALTMTNC